MRGLVGVIFHVRSGYDVRVVYEADSGADPGHVGFRGKIEKRAGELGADAWSLVPSTSIEGCCDEIVYIGDEGK